MFRRESHGHIFDLLLEQESRPDEAVGQPLHDTRLNEPERVSPDLRLVVDKLGDGESEVDAEDGAADAEGQLAVPLLVDGHGGEGELLGVEERVAGLEKLALERLLAVAVLETVEPDVLPDLKLTVRTF